MNNPNPQPPYRELRRSTKDRMFAGVCGGLGEFFGIDPTVVRLLFVFGVIFGYGIMILVYLVLFLVVPEDNRPLPAPPVPPVPPAPVKPVEPPAPAEPGSKD